MNIVDYNHDDVPELDGNTSLLDILRSSSLTASLMIALMSMGALGEEIVGVNNGPVLEVLVEVEGAAVVTAELPADEAADDISYTELVQRITSK